ncbi:MAG: pyrrolo-quinoline quinone [Burkholderiaceae bacterium]
MKSDAIRHTSVLIGGALLAVAIGSCGGGGSSGTGSASSGAASQASAAPTIASQPRSQSLPVGFQATFSVTVSNPSEPVFQWQKNGSNIAGATGSTYTTTPVAPGDSGSTFVVTVSDAAGTTKSSTATLTVVGPDVTTYHNDNLRSGTNPYETALTPATVTSANFGLLRTLPVDGLVDAQPLYLHQIKVGSALHNVVYAVTENDSVYAFDADTGAQLWQRSALLANETASDDRGCSQVTPTIGITDTPVIDRSAGPNGALYFDAMSKDAQNNYYHRLHALDLTTGAELFGGPTTIAASYPYAHGTLSFSASQYKERAALLLVNGTIYIAFTSHCDDETYYGWLMAYSESTLKQTAVLNVTPNGSEGSIWQAGGGPAADADGNIYFLDANGTFDTSFDASGFPASGDFGNAFLKISTAGGLKVADYFAAWNTVSESANDEDLGSGGAMLLPDLVDSNGKTRQLAVGAGKDAHIYVVDRNAMGKFNAASSTNSNVYQDLASALGNHAVYSVPAYFNRVVYYAAVGDQLKALPVSAALVAASPSSTSTISYTYPGASPSVSANGTTGGIVWTVQNTTPAVLHAYDATNLAIELYNSSQQGSRDQFGAGNKFIAPVIVDGKVLVGTPNAVAVFGLLH